MIFSGNSGAIESAVLVVTASTSHCLEIPKRRNQGPSAGRLVSKAKKSNSRYFDSQLSTSGQFTHRQSALTA